MQQSQNWRVKGVRGFFLKAVVVGPGAARFCRQTMQNTPVKIGSLGNLG